MLDDISRIIRKAAGVAKAKVYGRTFACPVCHLELSFHDLDDDGLVVCPVCGAVLEVTDVGGHPLPIVITMEVVRHQPNLRLHPLATHLPIALMPLALLGALALVLLSLFMAPAGDAFASMETAGAGLLAEILPVVGKTVLLFLYISVLFSLLTMTAGFWDWRTRFRGRSYRIIHLKLGMAAVFFLTGAAAALLHQAGLVFSFSNGLVQWSMIGTVSVVAYMTLLVLQFIAMATLGHLGGYLVHGK